jgi:hypothetical protein
VVAEQQRPDASDNDSDEKSEAYHIFKANAENSTKSSGIMVNVTINGNEIQMQLDTGADVSLINKRTCEKHFTTTVLEESDIILKGYTSQPIKVLAKFRATVSFQGQEQDIPLVVVDVEGNKPPLFGLNWIKNSTELEVNIQLQY